MVAPKEDRGQNRGTVIKLLKSCATRIQLVRLQAETALLSAVLPLGIWAALLVEHFSDHEPTTRAGLRELLLWAGGLWLFALVLLVGWRLLLRKGKPGLEETALRIGWGSDSVRDRLLNGLQVLERGGDPDRGFDPDLVAASLDHVVPELDGVDFSKVLPVGRRRRDLKRAGLVWGLSLGLLLLGGDKALLAGKRLWDPGRDFRGAPAFSLALDIAWEDSLGTGRLLDRQPADISVAIAGDRLPREVELIARDTSGAERAWTLPVELGRAGLRAFVPGRELVFSARAVEHRLDRSRVIRSEERLLPWASSPRIDSLGIRVSPPAYTGLPVAGLSGSSTELNVPIGSRMRLSLMADRPLQDARMLALTTTGDSLDLAFDLSPDGSRAELVIRARRDLEFMVRIRDGLGIGNPEDLQRRLRVIVDQQPRLRMIRPLELEGDIERALVLPIAALASDDYGFSACRVAVRRVSGRFGDPDVPDPGQVASLATGWDWQDLELTRLEGGNGQGARRAGMEHVLDLVPFDLLPDDEIQFFVELWDNNGWNGPQRVTSALFRYKLPGMEELFAESEQGQAELAEDARTLLDRSMKNQERLQELREEMRRDPEMTWEREQKLKQVVQEQQEIVQEAAELAQKLEQLEQKAEQNRLISPELQQKLAQLKELLQNVMNEELLEKLRKAAEQAMKQPEQEMTRPQGDMEEVLKQMEEQLDRFLAVLEEMRLEQKLEELARRSEQLLEDQRSLHRQMEQQQNEQRLAEQESRQQQEAERLQEELDQLEQDFADKQSFPQEQVDQSQSIMQDRQVPQRLDQFQQQLEQGTSPDGEQREKMDQDLNELAAALQMSLDQMRQQQREQLGQELDALAQELLMISLGQEGVGQELPRLSMRSPLVPELAERTLENQLGVRAGAEEAWRLSRKSFHVPKGVLPELGSAEQQLGEMLEGFHERRLGSLRGLSPEVMGRINRVVLMLKEASQQMQSGASASGLQEMMEKMAQASGEQQCLNGQCKNLMSMKPGQSEKPMSISFGEAQKQQSGIRQDIESLQEQMGEEGREMLGDLGKTASDMREVEEDLANQTYTERTAKLQERILSRLLDAQRSIRRQDESKQRESRSASRMKAQVGDDQQVDELREQLRRELLQALDGDYTPESESLIRDYFRALEVMAAEAEAGETTP